MAHYFKTYYADGDRTDFAVPFSYLEREHIQVRVDKIATTDTASIYKFVWLNDASIRVDSTALGAPVPNGLEVQIQRKTDIDEPAVVFQSGATLSTEDLNKSSQYLTYALQEAVDDNEEFTKLYLGARSQNPVTDNEGGELQLGVIYLNTEDENLYSWDGTDWIAFDNALATLNAANAAMGYAEDAYDSEQAAAASVTAAAASAAEAAADEASAFVSASGLTRASAEIADAGIDNTTYMTPLLVKNAVTHQHPTATQAEAEAGTNNTKDMTPLRTKQAITAQVPALLTAVGYEHLGASSISSETATWEFEDLDSTRYSGYIIYVTNIVPNIANAALRFRLKSAGDGASYIGQNPDYEYSCSAGIIGSTAIPTYSKNTGSPAFQLLSKDTIRHGSSSDGWTGEITIRNAHGTGKILVISNGGAEKTSTQDVWSRSVGTIEHSNPGSAGFQLLFYAGATTKILSGSFSVVGVIN